MEKIPKRRPRKRSLRAVIRNFPPLLLLVSLRGLDDSSAVRMAREAWHILRRRRGMGSEDGKVDDEAPEGDLSGEDGNDEEGEGPLSL